MKAGIIGTGVVAQTLGSKLLELGHDVALGTRDPQKLDEKTTFAVTLREWLVAVKGRARVVTLRDADVHGELLINVRVVH
jgi:predicted dinucleotide-binding enzyme